jgi:hypothetical protein
VLRSDWHHADISGVEPPSLDQALNAGAESDYMETSKYLHCLHIRRSLAFCQWLNRPKPLLVAGSRLVASGIAWVVLSGKSEESTKAEKVMTYEME